MPSPLPSVPEGRARSARDEARALLRDYGLGVPPGATLRDVEIVRYDVWGESETQRTRAVVFPRRPGEPAFALIDSWVPWPVHAFGPVVEPAVECERGVDMRARAMELHERIERRRRAAEDATGEVDRQDYDAEQAAWADVRRTCPWVAWPLLEDVGRHDLAERTTTDATSDALVRVGLSESLVFGRALTHYMQGLDVIARAEVDVAWRLSRELTTNEPAEGEPHSTNLSAFRVELERRAQAGPVPDPEVPEDGPVPESFVAPLVASLENVDARQQGQPGGIALSRDLRVDALIRVGEPAVPALLECLERDERWTRAVHFWRDFAPSSYTVLGVYEACYVALANILGEDFFDFGSTGGNLTNAQSRRVVAGNVRAYWERWRDAPPLERRWQVLLDDDRSPSEWAVAADWLTTGGPHHESTYAWSLGRRGPSPGESIRAERDVALRELLARRTSSAFAEDSDAACSLLGSALAWAGGPFDALVPVARACAEDDDCPCRDGIAERFGPLDPDLAMTWLRATPELFLWDWGSEERIARMIELLRHPGVVREASRRLRALDATKATDANLRRANSTTWVDLVWPLAAHLDAARAALRRGLASRAVVARLRLEQSLGSTFVVVARPDGYSSVVLPEPFEAPRDVRVSDFVAWRIAGRLGVRFSLGWSSERRDAAIADVRRRLARHPDPSVQPLADPNE
ncbi:MAG: hypothetical protein R3B99_27570 [Polyangiales bacterium]